MERLVEIKSYLSEKRKIVENALLKFLPEAEGSFETHIEAMRYSLFVGGKRIRPILCLAAGDAVNKSKPTQESLLPVACALECIHTYSLIHDDLPAMDDDVLRRGKPTNHTVYGEAEAILAGDSLLTWAFELLSSVIPNSLSTDKRLKIINIIASASGPTGMAGGQALDIANENKTFPFNILETIHKSKTGALITCSVQAGAIGAGGSKQQINALITYGNYIGLAFQIVDDLLNVTATTEELGKTAGSDADRGKATYPSFFGVQGTITKAKDATDRAIEALNIFDHNADPLRELARYVFSRRN